MPRAIWTGAISFGLVNVPVRLYSAVQRRTVRFNQLDSEGNVRIQQKRVNPLSGEEVPYERLVKGYEIAPGSYVVVEPEELEALEPRRTKTIDILDFVDLVEIDPIFYDHPYYLAPGAGGSKPYKLLLEAMRETGKVAIGTVVIRQKQAIVALRPSGDVLQMATLVYADEIVPTDRLDDLPDEDVEIGERELAIAKQLVESLAADWDPARYKDEYREKVLQLIESKAAGEEIAVQPDAEEAAPVPDLMSALKASLEAVQARDGDPEPTEPGKKKAPQRKRAAAPKRKAAAKSG
ncbi:MAG TPA: Ku protein [Solirubrobacteraceae bacterium]|jgi:DNA end-binding protein Ku|nr:Ku protein [Solirubrobacteraceae bacterium]